MKSHTRREFLRNSVLVGGTLALGPAASSVAQQPTGASNAAKMCIARWKGDTADMKALATKLTEQAVATIGGMGQFVKSGNVVWVKPNIGWDKAPEFAANTNPDVVATVIKLCFEAGAKQVKVGDYTCNDARSTYANSGIEAAAKAAGADVVFLDKSRFKETEIGGQKLKTWPVYPEIIESDVVINVPIVKHHGGATMTACMKNYMGVIGGQRGKWHQDFPGCLTDITAFMKPPVCIVDAIRILTANGPQGGNLDDVKQLNTVAAGTDIVALDAFCAELLGLKPAELHYVAAAEKAGLGSIDYRSSNLKEIEVTA